MSVIALGSAKGSPGATTTALALAAAWPGAPASVALADLDPVGGDVFWRSRVGEEQPLDPDRGLLSLAAGVRRGAEETRLADHLQRSGSGEVLVGVRSPEQVGGIGSSWSQIPLVLQAHPGDVLADCGRIVPGSPAMPVLVRADLVCLVARPDLEGSAHLRERLRALREAGDVGRPGGVPVAVLLVGDHRRAGVVGEMQQLLDHDGLSARVVGLIATDPRSAAAYASAGRMPRTSLLARSAAGVVPALRQLSGTRAEPAAGFRPRRGSGTQVPSQAAPGGRR